MAFFADEDRQSQLDYRLRSMRSIAEQQLSEYHRDRLLRHIEEVESITTRLVNQFDSVSPVDHVRHQAVVDLLAEHIIDQVEINRDLQRAFNPHGFFVYILYSRGMPLYVGQSTNVLTRLGSHMQDAEKRRRTTSIRVLRVRTKRAMDRVERSLILRYSPPLNTAMAPPQFAMELP